MSVDTSTSGGPNSAVGTGGAGVEQSGPGAARREPGTGDGANRGPEGGSATGNQTGGEQNPSNGGLAAVFQGGPEAGKEREPGTLDSANRGPDRAGQPKGNHQAEQSTDSITLPTWAQQLPKKLTSDPKQVAKLSAFKSMDDLVQAYLGAEESFALPGEKSTPEEIQAFYERLGKPKEEAGYSFAKSDPELAAFAFEANLSGAQADALYKVSQKQLNDLRQGIEAQTAKDFAATEGLLQKEFGDRYEEAIVLMRRGLGINPKTGELSPVAKSLFEAGLAGKPEIVRAFIELGRATSEGTAAGGSSHAGQAKSVTEGRGFRYREDYSQK